MNNKQLFDLTSPPSAEFHTAQLLDTAIIMQNRMAIQWQPNIPKRKIAHLNLILEESTKKFETSNRRRMKTNII